ncbi:DUF2637 domain-containing protein [Streptomyces fumanus]|uniref:DUF2637 domain-containing protein n=1 Tax=Streptomyces fumanus TaxID=67302 RepID=A0A919A2W7_9ACTN|nr:DUF2637 domain-containing protein [Streptomyces fumanus]GHE84953.1 hypothetical protein GCM10018772_05120 [Streptomyces fumanus]
MKNPALTLAVIAAAASITLTGAAFWLSYEHLHDVARNHGLADAARAWAWPATVDLFVIVGEVLMLRAALAGRTDRWAVFLTVAGSGGSIALNVAGVGGGADVMNYVVAAVPPVAALLAFGAIMRQIHGMLATRVAPAPARPVAPRPVAATPAATARPPVARPLATASTASSAAPTPAATPEPSRDRPRYDTGTPQYIVHTLWLRLGHRPTEGAIVTALGDAGLPNSRAQAGKIRRQVEAENPALPGPRAA